MGYFFLLFDTLFFYVFYFDLIVNCTICRKNTPAGTDHKNSKIVVLLWSHNKKLTWECDNKSIPLKESTKNNCILEVVSCFLTFFLSLGLYFWNHCHIFSSVFYYSYSNIYLETWVSSEHWYEIMLLSSKFYTRYILINLWNLTPQNHDEIFRFKYKQL